MIADPHSLAWRIERCRFLGLVVAARGTPVLDGERWAPDPTPWARAPAREEWPAALDVEADGPAARCWVIEACTDGLLVARARQRWREEWQGPELSGADAVARLGRLGTLLDAWRPTWDEADATLRALIEDARMSAPEYAPLSREQGCSVLGWSREQMDAAIRRGDVRTVKVGGRRMIPYDEMRRLTGG